MDYFLLESLSTTTFLVTFVLLFVLYVLFFSFNQRKEPPGPWRLPVIGNLLQLDPKLPCTSFYQLYKKHGPVFTFHFGPQKTVVFAGSKTIKQALVNSDAFSEKEVSPIISDMKLTHAIGFSNGDIWKELRHFALTNMKDFGMGKTAIEEKIIEESQRLIELFMETNGKALDTTQPINHAVCNIICSIVYGHRFECDDPVFVSMVDRASKNTQLMGSPLIQLYNFFPRLFGWLRVRKQLIESSFINRRHIKELVKGLQDTLNPQMCRGVVDSFLARKLQLEASGDMKSHYTEDNILMTVATLFAAGTDTTSATLRYGLLLMAKYPEIQDQVQDEINKVVGSRPIRVEDRKRLPYTNATIHDIQRITSAVPMTLHRTTRDVLFQGYFIKKGTPALFLLSTALFDEDEWETPHTLNPAHFLDKEGSFRNKEGFLPFSAGARVCTGESLARMELFLFFTSLLQHFCFTPPPGVKKEDLDLTQVLGITLTPKPHKLCAISRI